MTQFVIACETALSIYKVRVVLFPPVYMVMADIFSRMLWIFTQPSPNLPGIVTFFLGYICQLHPFAYIIVVKSSRLRWPASLAIISLAPLLTIETEKLIEEF